MPLSAVSRDGVPSSCIVPFCPHFLTRIVSRATPSGSERSPSRYGTSNASMVMPPLRSRPPFESSRVVPTTGHTQGRPPPPTLRAHVDRQPRLLELAPYSGNSFGTQAAWGRDSSSRDMGAQVLLPGLFRAEDTPPGLGWSFSAPASHTCRPPTPAEGRPRRPFPGSAHEVHDSARLTLSMGSVESISRLSRREFVLPMAHICTCLLFRTLTHAEVSVHFICFTRYAFVILDPPFLSKRLC